MPPANQWVCVSERGVGVLETELVLCGVRSCQVLSKCHGYIFSAFGHILSHNVCVILSIDLISVGDLYVVLVSQKQL